MPEGNAVNRLTSDFFGLVNILIERAGHRIGALGKVAAIVCFVDTGGAQGCAVVFGTVEVYARMTVGFEF